MCVCVYVYFERCTWVFVYLCVCLFESVCVFMCVSVCVLVLVYVRVCVFCVCGCVYMSGVCMCMSVSLYECLGGFRVAIINVFIHLWRARDCMFAIMNVFIQSSSESKIV